MPVEFIDHLSKRIVKRPARHAVPTFLGISLFSLLLAFAAGGLAARPAAKAKADGFATIRTKTIQSQLDQVEGDYLIVIGDSHAERLYLPKLCGLDILNAGMSGATALQVLDLARSLNPRRKAKRLFLIVGTNDIWIRRHPGDPGAAAAFRATLNQLLDQFHGWAAKVTLIAIPPVASRQAIQFPRSAAERFTAAMREVCDTGRCDVVSVFDPAAEQAGTTPSGIGRDGVHLANYARYVRAAEPRLCGGPAVAADVRDDPAKPSMR